RDLLGRPRIDDPEPGGTHPALPQRLQRKGQPGAVRVPDRRLRGAARRARSHRAREDRDGPARVLGPRLHGDTTTSFVGAGVDAQGETELWWLAVIVEGDDLTSRQPRGVTMGVGLARAFGVKPGDDLTLLTTTQGGAINALAVKVRGVWESGEKAYDDRFLRIGLAETQRVLDLEGGEVQSIVLLLDATDQTAAVRAQIERLIRDRGLDLEIKTWEDLALRYHQVRELFGRIFAVLTLIVSVMVVFGIT